MPKRRRLLLSPTKKVKVNAKEQITNCKEGEVIHARVVLKGALMDAMEPFDEDSDASVEPTPTKQDRNHNTDTGKDNNSDSDDQEKKHDPSPPRQSYVLKLFDRSVDLSQFKEDSPLYPICRAWIANKPKANYNEFGKRNELKDEHKDGESIELPGPEGPPVSRIPELLPEQKVCNKNNINLNYKEAPPPSIEKLIEQHSSRWCRVRRAWLEQSAKVEARYHAAQEILNKLSVNSS